MPANSDVYGALANYIQENIPDYQGVWIADEPEEVTLPYAVLEDGGFDTDWQFEAVFVDGGKITVHTFAGNVDDARALGASVQTLFGPSNSQADIPTDGTFKFIEVTRTNYQLVVEPEPDIGGARVYQYSVGFKVVIQGVY